METTALSAGSISPSSGSPRDVYMYFLLSLCREYFTQIKNADDATIDALTAGLVAFTPDREVREQLWREYLTTRTKYSSDKTYQNNAHMSASVVVVGSLISYLNDAMEFTERSSGAFL